MARNRPNSRSGRPNDSSHSSKTQSDARPNRAAITPQSKRSSLTCFNRSALSISGVFLLTFTKFTDALTTGIGLRYIPDIYEMNPIANAAFEQLGIVEGLLWSSFVVVVAITVFTEISATAVATRRPDGHLAPVVRLVGYGIPATVFALVSIYNVRILLAGFDLTVIL